MPSVISSIIQGLKRYKSLASYQLHNNTVAQSYESAKMHGQNPVKAAAGAVAAGAATFLAPPVIIGMQAVKDYDEKKRAEEQATRLHTMISALKSHGISPQGATEMANQIIMNQSTGHYISDADFKMWMVVASVLEPELAEFTPRIVDRRESAKSQLQLA